MFNFFRKKDLVIDNSVDSNNNSNDIISDCINKIKSDLSLEYIPNEFNFIKKFDSKREYEKVLFDDLLKEYIDDNTDNIKDIYDNIYSNIYKFINYLDSNDFVINNKRIKDLLCGNKILRNSVIKNCFELQVTITKQYNGEIKKQLYYMKDINEIMKKVSLNSSSRDQIKKERAKMSDSLRYDVLKRDGFKCQICGATQEDGVKLHVDHIIPVSKGGKTTMSNLRVLCERCNEGKSNKLE